jgi:hypothetical protein
MPRIVPGIIGLLTIPVLGVAGIVPLPMGWISLPSGLLAVVAVAAVAAWIDGASSDGWLAYGLGLASGTLGGLFVIAAFASSLTMDNWLISAEEFRRNLALTVVLITAAAAIGYVAGARMTRRFARPHPRTRPGLLATALPVVAMGAVALGYPMIVPERALLKADAPTVTLAVSASGRLTIEPTEFRAGPAIWEIESTFDGPLTLVMVAIRTDADLERLKTGDPQGFEFRYFAEALPGPGSRTRFDTETAHYAIYFEEGGEGQAQPAGPIPPERLVIVDVRP